MTKCEYAIYRFEKTKIAFDYYYLINFKLYWLTFNYFKFYVIRYYT